MKNADNKSFSFKARILSFKYAGLGIRKVFLTQHNFIIHVIIGSIAVFSGFYFEISFVKWLAIILSIGIVLAAELFNSAIEILADVVSPGYNEKIGLAKDVAAGAVLVTALMALAIGLIVFLPEVLILVNY